MTSPARQRLRELVQERAVVRGEVTLASGQKSSYYIDGRMVLMASEAAALIGEVLYDLTKDLNLNAIGGPAVGAIPMATAAVIRYHQAGRPMEGFFVRREAKAYGMQKLIEGRLRPGDRVALVEDVLTTGGSVAQAVEAVRQAGATIEVVIGLVDRLQGARAKMESMGLRLESVFTLHDLGLAAPA
jgi:orotate phosphoribosyltransferase